MLRIRLVVAQPILLSPLTVPARCVPPDAGVLTAHSRAQRVLEGPVAQVVFVCVPRATGGLCVTLNALLAPRTRATTTVFATPPRVCVPVTTTARKGFSPEFRATFARRITRRPPAASPAQQYPAWYAMVEAHALTEDARSVIHFPRKRLPQLPFAEMRANFVTEHATPSRTSAQQENGVQAAHLRAQAQMPRSRSSAQTMASATRTLVFAFAKEATMEPRVSLTAPLGLSTVYSFRAVAVEHAQGRCANVILVISVQRAARSAQVAQQPLATDEATAALPAIVPAMVRLTAPLATHRALGALLSPATFKVVALRLVRVSVTQTHS